MVFHLERIRDSRVYSRLGTLQKQHGTATLEISLTISLKTKHATTI